MTGKPLFFRRGKERGFKFYMTVALRLSYFFPLFRLFFRFVNENVLFHRLIIFCLFVESSSHLRWLVIVFPNSNRLFSDIPLSSLPPYPFPPPPPPSSAKNFKLDFSISLECSERLLCHTHYFKCQSFVSETRLKAKEES